LAAVKLDKAMGEFDDGPSFIVGDGLECLFPIKPEVASVFVGKGDFHFFSFGKVPIDLLC
jgi:hypothetical protein